MGPVTLYNNPYIIQDKKPQKKATYTTCNTSSKKTTKRQKLRNQLKQDDKSQQQPHTTVMQPTINSSSLKVTESMTTNIPSSNHWGDEIGPKNPNTI